jgi:multimeric flavodoxin WrbA
MGKQSNGDLEHPSPIGSAVGASQCREAAVQVLLLDGSPEGDEFLEAVRRALLEEIEESGAEAHSIVLRDGDPAPCRGCFGCWIRTPGVCVIADSGRDIARRAVRSDILVYLTPVTFGGYS